MAKEDDKLEHDAELVLASGEPSSIEAGADAEPPTIDSLGAEKYVFAAFFCAGICMAFLVGQTLSAIWNRLVDEPWVIRKVPQLMRVPEEERPTYMMLVGAVVAIVTVVSLLRKDSIRTWADDVALELSKVTWPKKETVTNGTIVVIAAGVFATVYIGLLDRLWGFVTTLVYGA